MPVDGARFPSADQLGIPRPERALPAKTQTRSPAG